MKVDIQEKLNKEKSHFNSEKETAESRYNATLV